MVSQDIAGGMLTQRNSNTPGRGENRIITATVTIVIKKTFMGRLSSDRFVDAPRPARSFADYLVSAGNCRIFLSSPLVMLATYSAQRANAVFTWG